LQLIEKGKEMKVKLNRMKSKIWLAVIVAGLLQACSNYKKSNDYLEDAVTLNAIEIFSNEPYRASRTREIDIIHTDLKVDFDWDKQYMNGLAVITFSPYFYKINSFVLDAKGQEIKEVVLLNGTEKKELIYTYENDKLNIQLDRYYTRSEKLKVYIDYVAKPEERMTTSGIAVTDDKGLYFIDPLDEINRKPQQIWTQGETVANSVWFPTIDSPNERCTHQISIKVNNKFTTLSNGDLISSEIQEDGSRIDVWVQNKPIAPYLFMMAIGEFATVQDSLNGMKVDYYVDQDYAPFAKEIFKNTPEMITHYSDLLGYPYPWSKYSQVVVHDYVSGAMENVSAVIFGDYVQQTHREMIDGDHEETVAHELFHHWFGDVVTCESWSNLPLNESFATYGEYLWFEYKYGKTKADEHIYYDLESYLEETQNGGVYDLIRFQYRKPDDMFDSHSYAKGGRVLHMLRNYVGDEAFFESLKLYLHDNAYSSVEIHQLRLAFEKVTGEDLNWFFNQWFLAKGHPELEINYSYDSASAVQTVIVEQLQDTYDFLLYQLPVDIDIYSSGSKQTYSVVIDKAKQSFTFNVAMKPDLVNFDSKKILICTKKDNHTLEEMEFMYHQGPLYMDKREAIEFAFKDESNSSMAKKLLLDAMLDDYSGIRELAVSKYAKFDEIEDLQLKDVLISTMQNDDKSSVRVEAVIALYDYFSWSKGMIDVFVDQIEKDSSYMVISELIRGVAISDSTLGISYSDKFKDSESLDVLFSVAEVYSVFGDKDDNAFFKKLYSKVDGYEILTYIDYYKDYLLQIEDVSVQKEALNVFETEARNQLGWFVRYYAIGAITDLRSYYLSISKMHKKKGNEDLYIKYTELVQTVDAMLILLKQSESDGRVFMYDK
jgi:aminopeptidase N